MLKYLIKRSLIFILREFKLNKTKGIKLSIRYFTTTQFVTTNYAKKE